MEKRVLLAALLSALFLAVYSTAIGPRTPLATPEQATAKSPAVYSLQQLEQEDVAIIGSPAIQIEIGQTSAAIRRVTLKQFQDASGKRPLQFGEPFPLLRPQINGSPVRARLLKQDQDSVKLETFDASNNYYISYKLTGCNTCITIEIADKNGLSKQPSISLISSWSKGDSLSERYNILETNVVTKKSDRKLAYRRLTAPVKQEIVLRGTLMLAMTEQYFCQILKPTSGAFDTYLFQAPSGWVASAFASRTGETISNPAHYSARLYFGPRDYFYLKNADFESAFPVGIIGQIGLLFLMFLAWLGRITHSFGLAIVLFSVLITGITAPLTLLSIKSMKKMQELKPKIDKIMAQHKDDKTKANQAVFALYREHRVSPISGCLPIVLQMPVFIALFQAMSHFIELRGKSFLWINDLSLPDRAAQLPFALPILGKDFNLLPIIMAVAMYAQTKLSQQSVSAESNPTAKMLSGPVMPLIFCVMFYNIPSGLVLYWLTNSLLSLVLYRIAK